MQLLEILQMCEKFDVEQFEGYGVKFTRKIHYEEMIEKITIYTDNSEVGPIDYKEPIAKEPEINLDEMMILDPEAYEAEMLKTNKE